MPPPTYSPNPHVWGIFLGDLPATAGGHRVAMSRARTGGQAAGKSPVSCWRPSPARGSSTKLNVVAALLRALPPLPPSTGASAKAMAALADDTTETPSDVACQ